jgi:predicted heme/steroid binding protein
MEIPSGAGNGQGGYLGIAAFPVKNLGLLFFYKIPGKIYVLPSPVGAEQFKTAALEVSGSTVYIGGNYVVQGVSRAYFWKSGDSKISDLPLPRGAGNFYVSALAVSGNELYVAGDGVMQSIRRAYYWKYGDTQVTMLPLPRDLPPEAVLGDFVVEAIALPEL